MFRHIVNTLYNTSSNPSNVKSKKFKPGSKKAKLIEKAEKVFSSSGDTKMDFIRSNFITYKSKKKNGFLLDIKAQENLYNEIRDRYVDRLDAPEETIYIKRELDTGLIVVDKYIAKFDKESYFTGYEYGETISDPDQIWKLLEQQETKDELLEKVTEQRQSGVSASGLLDKLKLINSEMK